MGMLTDGEVLLDDIQVIQDPSGTAINLIQNSTFEADSVGSSAATWRLIGNHRHSEVIVDPDDPANQVLRFVATGATEHMHNHAETTLKNRERDRQHHQRGRIRDFLPGEMGHGLESAEHASVLQSPTAHDSDRTTGPAHGTPGRQNSTYVDNLGPVYHDLHHAPVVPDADEPVTVSVDITDAQTVADAQLWYSVEGGTWASVPMTRTTGSDYAGQIPASRQQDIVQFYVSATDSLGATTTFPREGRESRALYKVQDGLASDVGSTQLADDS